MRYSPQIITSLAITVGLFIGGITSDAWGNPAAIVDNEATLYVPVGETYTLDGVHAYTVSIDIDGTLYVTDYDGSGTTGTRSTWRRISRRKEQVSLLRPSRRSAPIRIV